MRVGVRYEMEGGSGLSRALMLICSKLAASSFLLENSHKGSRNAAYRRQDKIKSSIFKFFFLLFKEGEILSCGGEHVVED